MESVQEMGHVDVVMLPRSTDERRRQIDMEAAQRAASALLVALGADLADEGLRETPRRMAAAYAEMLTPERFHPTTFPNETDGNQLVMIRAIPFHSLCMHHLLPFYGLVHIGYIPKERILGVSKFARVVESVSRDLQVQERLTMQIANWLEDRVTPKGLGVVVEAEHLCMSLRGVRKRGSKTVTSVLRGMVCDDPRIRDDFRALVTAL